MPDVKNGFIAYSTKYAKELGRLQTHLATITSTPAVHFDAAPPPAGSQWQKEIRKMINSADVALLFISTDFMTSDYIVNTELPHLLRRWSRSRLKIIPVILHNCNYDKVLEQFGSLQAVPTFLGKLVPIKQWKPHQNGFDAARIQISAEIERHFSQSSVVVPHAIRPSGRPPKAFSLDVAQSMILSGEKPRRSWQPWITEVDLSGKLIADLSPLSTLWNLQKLNLAGSAATDLAPLRHLRKLAYLNCTGTGVADLKALRRIASLRHLDLDKTNIRDITALKDLDQLEHLDLDRTRVKNLAGLERLTKLRWLSLQQTKVIDIKPIADLTNLESLSLGYTRISQIGPLSSLRRLIYVNLRGCRVTDLSPVQHVRTLIH